MTEIRDKMVDYAGKIKAVDPSALIAGPEEWGWSGYFFSGYDQQYGSLHGWSVLPDRQSHAGADYLPWLLDAIHQSSAAAGRRLLDVFTVHYYPQGGEFGDDTSSAMQLRRNRQRDRCDPARRRNLDQRQGRRFRGCGRGSTRPSRHGDRDHRSKLGRGKPHQRRDDAG
jgi:hypothetical protein